MRIVLARFLQATLGAIFCLDTLLPDRGAGAHWRTHESVQPALSGTNHLVRRGSPKGLDVGARLSLHVVLWIALLPSLPFRGFPGPPRGRRTITAFGRHVVRICYRGRADHLLYGEDRGRAAN